MNRRLFILVVSIVIIIIVSSFVYVQVLRRSPLPAAAPGPSAWRGVVPGQTSTSELYQQMGTPVSSLETAAGKTISYSSANKYWTNDVNITQDKVAFIKERVFAPAEISLKKKLVETGKDWIRLYGPDSQYGSFLFAYPALGIALYADENHDVVYDVWHFPPTNTSGLLALPQAQGFSITLQPRQD